MHDAYLDVRHLVVTIVFGFIVVVAASQLPKLWRMEADVQKYEATARWWPFGEALRAGFVRSIPAAIIVCALLELAAVASLFEKLLPGRGGEVSGGFALAFSLPAIVMMLIDLSVTLFNCPKAVVPPAARGEPGALALWWSSRKYKRRPSAS